MASRFDALLSSTAVRHAQHVAYSVEMLGDIAAIYDRTVDQNELVCARSMLDAFYVHVRLLADFLVRRTSDLDFGPEDFGVDWTPPASAEAQRLDGYWHIASKYVVHFGRPRVPEDLEDLQAFLVGGSLFRRMALSVFDQFANEVSTAASLWDAGSEIPDPADTELWKLRVVFEQASILRIAHQHAMSKLAGRAADAPPRPSRGGNQ